MTETISLQKGEYSGEVDALEVFHGITLGTTSYRKLNEKPVMHFHQNPHFSLLITGNHIERRKKSEFQRKPGDILFCRAGESHEFLTEESARNINIELENDFLKDYEISENLIENSLQSLDAKLSILRMFYEFDAKDVDMEASIQILLLNLIHKNDCTTTKPYWIGLLADILNDRWNETVTLNELSSLLGVHPVTISKYFTKFFACTFGAYRRKLKISKSLELIKNSSLSITEIAYEAGFADQSHFIRNFKSVVGFTPKAFEKC